MSDREKVEEMLDRRGLGKSMNTLPNEERERYVDELIQRMESQQKKMGKR